MIGYRLALDFFLSGGDKSPRCRRTTLLRRLISFERDPLIADNWLLKAEGIERETYSFVKQDIDKALVETKRLVGFLSSQRIVSQRPIY